MGKRKNYQQVQAHAWGYWEKNYVLPDYLNKVLQSINQFDEDFDGNGAGKVTLPGHAKN